MRDVLEVISKLPPACLVWEAEQAWIIRRGVMGRAEYPVASEVAVVLWNHTHNVTQEQVAAMQAGSQLGWNCEGADIYRAGGDTTYVYSAPFQVLLSVNANHEEDAARIAEKAVESLVEYLKDTSLDFVLSAHRDGKLDLIEENKNGTGTDVQPD